MFVWRKKKKKKKVELAWNIGEQQYAIEVLRR